MVSVLWCLVFQLRRLYRTAADGKEIPESTAFDRAIERVQANIAWSAKHAAQIASLLAGLP